jgi:hypothetical protein
VSVPIAELSAEDRERLYLDDMPRWIGPTAPSTKYVQRSLQLAAWRATELADFMLDADPDDGWRLKYLQEDYARARALVRRLEAIERHLYTRSAEGMAGWIVR